VSNGKRELRELARLAGVQLGYVGHGGRRVVSGTESVLAVLRSLGHDVRRPEDAREALSRERARREDLLCEPVLVARGGVLALGERGAGARLVVDVSGREVALEGMGEGRFRTPRELGVGAFEARVEREGREGRATLLSSPRRCFQGEGRGLGLFLPLYAARPGPEGTLGIATYSDLAEMAAWAGGLGAALLGTLPLLATFLDEPSDPSPYAPVSRERWNELFVDVRATPEGRREAGVLDRVAGLAEASRLAEAAEAPYGRVWELAWEALQSLASAALASDERRRELEGAARRDPGLARYAAFRAWRMRQGAGWSVWRESLPEDLVRDWQAHADVRTFVYGQLEADRQLRGAQERARKAGCGLYLDLPVGAAADGFDTFAAPDQYLRGVTVGAPPDAFFTHGQSWGFRAPDPGAGREAGHEHFRRMVARHLERCSALRIDHVMMLHRLFCIPEGGDPADGVYVRHPSEELYAALAIESHRHEAWVVGENLGIVPREVNRGMRKWGMLGMRVGQFEFDVGGEAVLPRAGPKDLACMNTHDLAPWAAFWTGADVGLHVELGLLGEEEARVEEEGRARLREAAREELGLPRDVAPERDALEVLDAVQERLASGEASVFLASLEDMWGETRPQNVPGIGPEGFPSWKRRVKPEAARFMNDEGIQKRVRRLARARSGEAVGSEREEAISR